MKLLTTTTCFLLGLNLFSAVNKLESTGGPKSVFSKLKPNRVTFFSEFAGPSLDGRSYSVDSNGDGDSRDVITWNQVSFQWNISENSRFVFNPRFIINHSETSENAFDPESAVVGYAGSYKNGNFSANLGINTILPFMRDRDALEDRLMVNPGGFNSLNYKFNEAFSGSLWVWFRMKFYETRENPNETEKFSSFVAPNLTYNINDEVGSVSVFYRWDENIIRDKLSFEKNDNFNIMYSYTFNKHLTIQPFMTLFRSNDFSLKEAQVNMWLSGTIF